MKRFIVNCITLVRVPVIYLLAFKIGTDDAVAALVAYGVGLFSHDFDGIVAKWFRVEVRTDSIWHKLDTEILSLGLQLAAAAWLVRLADFSWWSIGIVLVYLAVTFGLQFLYIEPRKISGEPYIPLVLYGSGAIWMTLAILISVHAGAILTAGAIIYVLFLFVASFGFHPQLWDRWEREGRGQGGR